MYRIALCDNKISFAGEVESKLLELSCRKGISVQVEVFLNGEDLISEMGTSYFDAIYLRMEMQGENGIQIASRIRALDAEVLIIFISNGDHYVKKAFEVGAFRFLSDPIDNCIFEQYFDAIIKKMADETRYFYFTYCKRNFKLNISDILYFQSDRKLIYIIENHDIYKCYQKLNDIDGILRKEHTYFWRIHKSLLINPKYIVSYNYGSVEISDGTVFNIAEGRRKAISEFMKKSEQFERCAI